MATDPLVWVCKSPYTATGRYVVHILATYWAGDLVAFMNSYEVLEGVEWRDREITRDAALALLRLDGQQPDEVKAVIVARQGDEFPGESVLHYFTY